MPNFISKLSKFFQTDEVIKGILISGVATIVDFGFVALFTPHFHYLPVVITGFILGTIVNYFGYTRRVFHRAKKNQAKHILGFIIISVVGIAAGTGLISLLVEFRQVNVLIAKAASLVVVFFFNFVMRKILLLKF